MNCFKCSTPLPMDARFCVSCGVDVSGEQAGQRTLLVDSNPELLARLQTELGADFTIEKELGRGGMAIVFLGRDAHLGRHVAIKLLPPELTFSGDSGVIERFKREARMAATLDHPHIIPVYQVSTGGKLFWYVMKFLKGEALDHILIREGQLAVDRALEIVSQVAEALDYAHQNGVVHRDIKPANVMIGAKGWVTVTDFGIAKALDSSALTGSGAMIGTPYYMSPEQCSGKPVTGASDQYSLAVMMYQMLGGHLPFTGESVVDIIRQHVMDPVPPLGVLRPQLPEALVAAVERGLAKSPTARFSTCGAFVVALKEAAEATDRVAASGQRRVAPAVRPSLTAAASPQPGALRTVQRSWRERGWKLFFGGAGAIVALAAVGVIAVYGGFLRPGGEEVEQEVGAPAVAPIEAASAPPAVDTTVAVPVERPPAPSPSVVPARLALTRVPRGATIRRDGQIMRGASFDLTPGRSASIEVSLAGFEPWRRTVTLGDGEQREVAVSLQAMATVATAAQREDTPRAPVSTPAPAPPSAAADAPAPTRFGYISLLTNPRSEIYVNGQRTQRYPLINFSVPAGTVHLRFQVADSSGLWWGQDRIVVVNPGDTLRLGVIRLERP